MSRIVKTERFRTGLVADAEIAPHRYLFNDGDDSYRDATSYREFIAGVPYKEGDVIYVERMGNGFYYAAKARVIGIDSERDRFGDRREKYRVQFATAKGTWSLVWEYAHPGYIQRGYQCANLAPGEAYEHGLSAITDIAKFVGKLCKYANYLACLTAKDEVDSHYRELRAFYQRVTSLFPHNETWCKVNNCALYWERGTKATFSFYMGLKRADGSNLLSYNGGGQSVAGALRRAESYFNGFVGEALSKLAMAMFGHDPSGYHRPWDAEAFTDD